MPPSKLIVKKEIPPKFCCLGGVIIKGGRLLCQCPSFDILDFAIVDSCCGRERYEPTAGSFPVESGYPHDPSDWTIPVTRVTGTVTPHLRCWIGHERLNANTNE